MQDKGCRQLAQLSTANCMHHSASDRSRRALSRLPEKAATAAAEFVDGSLAGSPHWVGRSLRLGLQGLHSARRGDYRVIYHIDDHRRRVDVVAIEHRSGIYRPRQR